MATPLDIKRYEIKYYIPQFLVPDLMEFITPYMELDPFSANRPDNFYTIRSIYYDSARMDFFYEKMDGLRIRKKLRVRVYNEPAPDSPAFLEIKRRYENVIFKERVKVPFSQTEDICNLRKKPADNALQTHSSRIIEKFLYNLTQRNLRPTELVTYERIAFCGLMDNTLRLTVDKDVRTRLYPLLEEIYDENNFTHIIDRFYILELKFYGYMPKWMRRISSKFNIQAQSISKYCNGIEKCWKNRRDINSQPDLVTELSKS